MIEHYAQMRWLLGLLIAGLLATLIGAWFGGADLVIVGMFLINVSVVGLIIAWAVAGVRLHRQRRASASQST